MDDAYGDLQLTPQPAACRQQPSEPRANLKTSISTPLQSGVVRQRAIQVLAPLGGSQHVPDTFTGPAPGAGRDTPGESLSEPAKALAAIGTAKYPHLEKIREFGERRRPIRPMVAASRVNPAGKAPAKSTS